MSHPHPHRRRPDPFYDKQGDRATGGIWEERQKVNSYERIGVFLNTPEFGHDNLADVHLRWFTQVSGPKNKRTYLAEFIEA